MECLAHTSNPEGCFKEELPERMNLTDYLRPIL